MAIAWAIAVAAAVAGADLRVDGGVRTEGRSRAVDTRGVGRIDGMEVAVRPQVLLGLLSPDVDLDARYAPVLRAADVTTTARPDVLHVGELGARTRLGPAWTLRGSAGGERGTTDLVTEARLRGEAPQAIPTTSDLRFATARAGAALDGKLDPRTTLALGAGWSAGGGDDAASRALLPFARALSGNARVEWNATYLDVLTLQGTALGSRIADGRDAGVATLLGGWRHRIDRQLEARAGAGAAASLEDGRAQPRRRSLMPAGELGLAHASERLHLTEDAIVRLGSAVDRVTGTVDRTVEGELVARWAPTPSLAFAARAAAAFVRHEAGDGRRGSADVRVEQRLSRYLSLGFGVYAGWQRSADPALPSFVEGGAFGAFSVELARGGTGRP